MAENLARRHQSISANHCQFYHDVGACRHGNSCTRQHMVPTISRCILIRKMYEDPSRQRYDLEGNALPVLSDMGEIEDHFLDFYQDVWFQLMEFGEIEEMMVSLHNKADHLKGNVYLLFFTPEDAKKALLEGLKGRWFRQKPIFAEFCPVTDMKTARCPEFDIGQCKRGDFCNYVHAQDPDPDLLEHLISEQREYWKSRGRVDDPHQGLRIQREEQRQRYRHTFERKQEFNRRVYQEHSRRMNDKQRFEQPHQQRRQQPQHFHQQSFQSQQSYQPQNRVNPPHYRPNQSHRNSNGAPRQDRRQHHNGYQHQQYQQHRPQQRQQRPPQQYHQPRNTVRRPNEYGNNNRNTEFLW
ncbi:hypothetical protein PCE1_000800 [Barthelona sp. PCE]